MKLYNVYYAYVSLHGPRHTFRKQDQLSNRYDSILQWLWMENGLVISKGRVQKKIMD